jgi:hypothetical protein
MPFQFEPTPQWSFRLFHSSAHRFHTPLAPNAVFRFTQRWILGLVWERLEERKPWYERALKTLKEMWG